MCVHAGGPGRLATYQRAHNQTYLVLRGVRNRVCHISQAATAAFRPVRRCSIARRAQGPVNRRDKRHGGQHCSPTRNTASPTATPYLFGTGLQPTSSLLRRGGQAREDLARIPFQSNRNSLWLSLSGRIFCGEPVPTPGSSPRACFAGKCSSARCHRGVAIKRHTRELLYRADAARSGGLVAAVASCDVPPVR